MNLPDSDGTPLGVCTKIAELWSLTIPQRERLLGSVDQLERMCYVVGIYQALHAMFSNPDQANSWIHRPNAAPLFGGKPALDLMLEDSVNGLRLVDQYLNAQSH